MAPVTIYPPKIRPGKFLWSKNDVLMVVDLIIYIIIPLQKSPTMSFENLYPQKISGYTPGRVRLYVCSRRLVVAKQTK